MRILRLRWACMLACVTTMLGATVQGEDIGGTPSLQQLMQRLEALEANNRQLRQELGDLRNRPQPGPAGRATVSRAAYADQGGAGPSPVGVPAAIYAPPAPPAAPDQLASPERLFQDDAGHAFVTEDQLRKLVADEISKHTSAPAAAATADKSKLPDKPKVPDKPPEVKYPVINLTGFFQLDFAWFDQDAANRLSVGDIPDLGEFRRTRLAATGLVAKNVGYMIEMDFAFPGRPSFMDVWVEVKDLPFGNVRIGQFRQPFGMDGPTSVRELTFLERSLPFVFIPFRQTGIMAYGTEFDDAVTWAVSGYRFPADAFGGTFGDRGYGLSTRVTSALVNIPDDNFVVHLGGSYSYNRPSTGVLRYATPPEIGFNFGVPGTVPFFVDTGTFGATSVSLYGLEAAGSIGSFLIQSEVIATQIDPTTGSGAWLSGAYAQLSYVLTGEKRLYNAKQGVFGAVSPTHPFGPGGLGAWEVAARYSYLDFNDGPFLGGRLSDVTAGLNWYLNKYAKLQFNYIHAFLDHATIGSSNADVFAIRTQLQF